MHRILFLALASILFTRELAAQDSLEAEQAAAEDETIEGAASTPDQPAVPGSEPTRLTDEQAILEETDRPEAQETGLEPGERKDTDYFFVGALARALVIPTFLQNVFVSGGSTPIDGGGGAYFNYRRNGFNVQAELYYQSFYVDGYYKGLADPDQEYEQIHSELGVMMANVSFSWAIDITDWFAFEVGLGIGFGGTIGNLWRQEAYRDSLGGLGTCAGPNNPEAGGGFCEGSIERPNAESGRLDDSRTRGGTYQRSLNGGPGTGPNPFYFGDGGIPPIFFNLDLPRIALRFKPIRQVQLRAEAAYNLYGFSFGASAGYGF